MNKTATDAPPEGGCQCGAIRYRLTAAPLRLYVCHCRHCQKQSSSAFGMSLIVPPDALQFTRGAPKIWTTRADSGAHKHCAFCGDCGSRIYHAGDDRRAPISIKAGTLDDTSRLRPAEHIWTSRAQPWLRLDPRRFRLSPHEPPDAPEPRDPPEPSDPPAPKRPRPGTS